MHGALSALEGHLAIAVGNKLIVHSWDGESLTPVAFFDTPLHTATINVVKNFILLGDLQKGAFFLRWKDTGHEKHLTLLAKDFEHMDVLATEFLVDGSALSMLAADTTGNVFSLSYDPKKHRVVERAEALDESLVPRRVAGESFSAV